MNGEALPVYAGVVCDLDGVVYRGPAAVPHAVAALGSLPVPVVYATNNASRTPSDVAAHLARLGLDVGADAVATSAQAAAWLVADAVPPGTTVLAVGGPGVASALTARGLVAVPPGAPAEDVVAVVQGYGPEVTAADLAAAAYAVQGGARWVATNTDLTLPTDRGVAPGNGSLVRAVATAAGRPPDLVAGKPAAPLYRMCAERLGLGPAEVLAVGDRLDTDIEGAVAAGLDSLLVLTGVDGLDELLDAPPARRPTWVAADLRLLGALTGGDADGPGGAGLVAVREAVAAVHAARDAQAEAGVIRERVARVRAALSRSTPR